MGSMAFIECFLGYLARNWCQKSASCPLSQQECLGHSENEECIMRSNHWRWWAIVTSKAHWNELKAVKDGKGDRQHASSQQERAHNQQTLQNEGPKKAIEESDISHCSFLNSRPSTEARKHWHVSFRVLVQRKDTRWEGEKGANGQPWGKPREIF